MSFKVTGFQGGRSISPEEWVLGDAFEKMGDTVYIPGEPLKGIDLETVVIFSPMNHARALMELIGEDKRRWIVVTHDGDGRILNKERREFDISNKRRPRNVVSWYSVNVCSRGYGIFSIPLGLENPKWFPLQKKLGKLSIFQNQSRISNRLLYLNYNVSNNLPQRAGTYEYFSKYDWATVREGKNGVDYTEYLQEMISHDFVLCPEGNGPDTHRTWEALYLGTIPVLKKHVHHQEWKGDLPIVWVDEWEEITEEFLLRKKIEIESRTYDWKWLKISYWKNEIQKAKSRGIVMQGLENSKRWMGTEFKRRWERDYFHRRE